MLDYFINISSEDKAKHLERRHLNCCVFINMWLRLRRDVSLAVDSQSPLANGIPLW